MKTYFDRENIHVLGCVTARWGFDWVARASRVLVTASSRSRTCPVFTDPQLMVCVGKDCFGATPKPARETHALPTTRAKKLIIHPALSKSRSKRKSRK